METKIQELLGKLNIEDTELTKDDKYFVINLEDYDDFVKVYNKLEKSLDVFKNSLASFTNEEDAHVQYETDDGIILELVGVFDDDDYTLNISVEEDEEDN